MEVHANSFLDLVSLSLFLSPLLGTSDKRKREKEKKEEDPHIVPRHQERKRERERERVKTPRELDVCACPKERKREAHKNNIISFKAFVCDPANDCNTRRGVSQSAEEEMQLLKSFSSIGAESRLCP